MCRKSVEITINQRFRMPPIGYHKCKQYHSSYTEALVLHGNIDHQRLGQSWQQDGEV